VYFFGGLPSSITTGSFRQPLRMWLAAGADLPVVRSAARVGVDGIRSLGGARLRLSVPFCCSDERGRRYLLVVAFHVCTGVLFRSASSLADDRLTPIFSTTRHGRGALGRWSRSPGGLRRRR
jgi:hypothetical protein